MESFFYILHFSISPSFMINFVFCWFSCKYHWYTFENVYFSIFFHINVFFLRNISQTLSIPYYLSDWEEHHGFRGWNLTDWLSHLQHKYSGRNCSLEIFKPTDLFYLDRLIDSRSQVKFQGLIYCAQIF